MAVLARMPQYSRSDQVLLGEFAPEDFSDGILSKRVFALPIDGPGGKYLCQVIWLVMITTNDHEWKIIQTSNLLLSAKKPALYA